MVWVSKTRAQFRARSKRPAATARHSDYLCIWEIFENPVSVNGPESQLKVCLTNQHILVLKDMKVSGIIMMH